MEWGWIGFTALVVGVAFFAAGCVKIATADERRQSCREVIELVKLHNEAMWQLVSTVLRSLKEKPEKEKDE